MGADIGAILEKHPIEFEALSGRMVAIDAYNTIYQFLSIIRSPEGTPLMDSRGKITSHLSGLFYRTARIIEKGIKPIFVFDGEPPKFKARTIAARAAAKEEAKQKMKEAKERGVKELKVWAQATVRITDEIVSESKRLLGHMGIPVIQAPSEGEAQAAYMAKEGIVYAVGSQDYDSVLFGAPKLVRNITLSGRRKLPRKSIYVHIKPELIDLNESLLKLGIDQRQLIWIAMMAGTDYDEGVKGIGAKKGLEIAKKVKSLKEAYAAAGTSDLYSDELEEIEAFFISPPATDVEIRFEELKKDSIIDFLCGEHDFALERIESAIEKITKKPEKGGQSRLEGWF